MITRIEAYNYRCFKRLSVGLDGFKVFAGKNGAGKSTLLDLPALFADLVRTGETDGAFFETNGASVAPRALQPRELVHNHEGNYFSLAARRPFATLVYPVPRDGGLGVHYTVDLSGRGRFGPDTEWINGIDYSLDASRGAAFYAAIRRYWPGLPDGALTPDYTGIRPKLGPQGGAATDFTIEGPGVHGVAGLVNLFGIESPGLTASLALAEAVVAEAA